MTSEQNTPVTLVAALNNGPADFTEVMKVIDENYHFTPVAFRNGNTNNAENTNNGSCKIFAFAKLHKLSAQSTLNAFGDYYMVDVLQNPDNDDHQNIRNFIEFGWDGIEFSGEALAER